MDILRHSASHVMAQAVKELFPGVKLTFGPSTDTGFYYDFDYEKTFAPQDLEAISKRVGEIIKQDQPFIRSEVSKEEAIKAFHDLGETYKVEHLEDLPDRVSLYRQGTFPRSVRGSPSSLNGENQSVQAVECFWNLLERGRSESGSSANLWDRVSRCEGTGRVPPHAGGGSKERPPQAGTGARSIQHSGRGRSRSRHLSPEGGFAQDPSGRF